MHTRVLADLLGDQRLFTYKVIYDAGTAPNPYGGLCTLAICKPAIRRVAKPGDLVVGLASGSEGRVVYCMKVTNSLTWREYIDACSGKTEYEEFHKLALKIPKSQIDQGDCIWPSADFYEEALPSWSGHSGHDSFQHDVVNGANVLLSSEFWYFGSGDRFNVQLPKGLTHIIPGRGHRSNGNREFRDLFVRFFNEALRLHSIDEYGVHGRPQLAPDCGDESERIRCRSLQRLDDFAEEDQ